jgi:hypothetical protein
MTDSQAATGMVAWVCTGFWLWIALAGCETRRPEQSMAPITSAPLAMPSAQLAAAMPPPPATVARSAPEPPEFFAGTYLLQEDLLRGLEHARALDLRPVGATSLVFRTELEAPFRAAFKAPTYARPAGALNEVAAYRLARCLGLSNVPPAILRRMTKQDIHQLLPASYESVWPIYESRIVGDSTSTVEVAAIYWIEDMQDLGLEPPRELARVFEWLKIDGAPPPERATLATQMSTLFAFDYLIGNWDRWSGGNLTGDPDGDTLYMRDNDAGFAARLSEALHRKMLEPVQRTQRYSKSFVQAVRALTRDSYATELRNDPLLKDRVRLETPTPAAAKSFARPILDARVFDQLFDRRDSLLTHVAALIDEYGEDKVLSFP